MRWNDEKRPFLYVLHSGKSRIACSQKPAMGFAPLDPSHDCAWIAFIQRSPDLISRDILQCASVLI
jgi:hypothetical protein